MMPMDTSLHDWFAYFLSSVTLSCILPNCYYQDGDASWPLFCSLSYQERSWTNFFCELLRVPGPKTSRFHLHVISILLVILVINFTSLLPLKPIVLSHSCCPYGNWHQIPTIYAFPILFLTQIISCTSFGPAFKFHTYFPDPIVFTTDQGKGKLTKHQKGIHLYLLLWRKPFEI